MPMHAFVMALCLTFIQLPTPAHLPGCRSCAPCRSCFLTMQALQDSTRQYMLGDYLLVTVFTPKVRFPAGRWIDYWTGKEYVGPAEIDVPNPGRSRRRIVYQSGGDSALLAGNGLCGAEAGRRPVFCMSTLKGGAISLSTKTMVSRLDTRKEKFAQTDITCRRQENEAVLTIAPRQGTYTGMPQRRSFAVQIHGIRPARILLNNQSLAEGPQGWQWDNKANAVRLQVNEDPERKAPQVVQLLW